MPLISQESVSAEVPDTSPQEPAMTGPAHQQISLQAPLRLNPLVREALARVLSTCNETLGPPTVYRDDKGCFVPLDEFIRYGVQPSVALRALADTNMLVKSDAQGPPTSTRRIGEQSVLGVTIAASHIEGFASLPVEDGGDT